MKKRIHLLLLFISISFAFSFYNHPVKLTSSLIKYKASEKKVTIECKFFIDDFGPSLRADLEDKMNAMTLTKDDLAFIEKYIATKYKIFLNGEKVILKLENYKSKDNVLTSYIAIENISFKKGDVLRIENELLFEVFTDLQSNWMTIKIPPYISNAAFESNIDNTIYTQTLK